MCGRYQFTACPSGELERIARAVLRRYGKDAWTPGEIRPGAPAPVLLWEGREIRPALLTWGLPLPRTLVINARSETAAEKALFREALRSRRCAVPAEGFFEWDGAGRKYLFTLPDQAPLYMAGLTDPREGGRYCILTTEANASLEGVHPRMPLILPGDLLADWLGSPGRAEELLRSRPPLLDRRALDGQLSLW